MPSGRGLTPAFALAGAWLAIRTGAGIYASVERYPCADGVTDSCLSEIQQGTRSRLNRTSMMTIPLRAKFYGEFFQGSDTNFAPDHPDSNAVQLRFLVMIEELPLGQFTAF